MNSTPSVATSSLEWWNAQRLRYNVGLIVAGVAAFIAYMIVGSILLPKEADFDEPPVIAIMQGVAYLFLIGVANVLYFLGPLSERMLRPKDVERYRRVCFGLGFWFSVLLPFSIPVLLAVIALVHPGYWKLQPPMSP